MTRYVSVDDVFSVLTDWYHHRTDIQRCALAEALSHVQTADVEPVIHGTWDERIVEDREYDPYGFFRRRFYCSACGRYQTYGKTAYCPKCGAKMEEAE